MADGLERCLREMERSGIDVLMLGRESNAHFVSGATRLWLAGTRAFAPTCIVVRATGAVHLLSNTDDCFPRARTDANAGIYPMSWNPMTTVAAVAGIDGVADAARIGVDGMTPLFEPILTAALPKAEFVDGEVVLRRARRLKSDSEIDLIRSAIHVAQESLQAAVDVLRPGVSERELVGAFEERMARLGTSTPAYEGTFCVVDEGGPMRRFASDRVIEQGDLVAMSAGVLVGGWEGSLARTWPCGVPTLAHAQRWSRWSEGWAALAGQVRPGARVGNLPGSDDGARIFGVGLGYEGLGADDVLEPGMVVGLELVRSGILVQEVLAVGGAGTALTSFPYPAFGP